MTRKLDVDEVKAAIEKLKKALMERRWACVFLPEVQERCKTMDAAYDEAIAAIDSLAAAEDGERSMSKQLTVSDEIYALCELAAKAKGEQLDTFVENSLWMGMEDATFHSCEPLSSQLEEAMEKYGS